MMGFPGSAWAGEALSAESVVSAEWDKPDYQVLPGLVSHTFTHFHLELRVLRVGVETGRQGGWCQPDALDTQALPTVMKKVARLVLAG